MDAGDFLKRFDNLFNLKAAQPRRARDVPFVGADVLPGSEEWLQLDGREEDAQRLALTLPESFGAASNVAKMCAQHDPHVGRQTGPDEKPEAQKDHAFERVMWRPNPWMSNTFLWWFLYIALPIRGEAFIFVEDGGLPKGDVLELWPIPPWRVKPVPSKNTKTFISHYNYFPVSGANPIKMAASNICWIRQPNVVDLHAGMSTVSPAQRVVDVVDKLWRHRINFWGKQRARPAMAVGIKKDVTPTAFATLKREWFEMDVLKRATLLHRMGDIDIKNLGQSADDQQLLQFQEHDAGVIQRLFGWNTSLDKATSFAHADVARDVMAQVHVWPLMRLVAGALTAQVMQPRYGEDMMVYHKLDDVIPKRADAKRADYQVYGQDMTTNELRVQEGKEPITDGPLAELYETVTIRTLQMAQPKQAEPEPEPQAPQTPAQVVSDEAKADLIKWERKALRTVKESGIGAAAFESEHIPADLHALIVEYLGSSKTDEEVKEAFGCVLQPLSFS